MIQLKELILVSILMLAAPFIQGGLQATNNAEDAHEFLPKRRVELTHSMSMRPQAVPAVATRISERTIATPAASNRLEHREEREDGQIIACEPLMLTSADRLATEQITP